MALTEEPFMERFTELRTRLQELRYHQPIDLASAPLVESLLDDLCSANDQLIELRQQGESQAQELIVAQNQARRRAPCSSAASVASAHTAPDPPCPRAGASAAQGKRPRDAGEQPVAPRADPADPRDAQVSRASSSPMNASGRG